MKLQDDNGSSSGANQKHDRNAGDLNIFRVDRDLGLRASGKPQFISTVEFDFDGEFGGCRTAQVGRKYSGGRKLPLSRNVNGVEYASGINLTGVSVTRRPPRTAPL